MLFFVGQEFKHSPFGGVHAHGLVSVCAEWRVKEESIVIKVLVKPDDFTAATSNALAETMRHGRITTIAAPAAAEIPTSLNG
ncbi:MAG: hypothetical protein I8H71_04245 [Xanthomonadaceae bacterium]|nr:hypothetical protein [Xanthomonadaceae bacterium]